MADVFLSYKREDQERVKPLADALEADGLSVWWDARIEGGTAWRQMIETELQAARCVVVVWSETSIGPAGEFVHDEAAVAKARGVYLPVRIDPVSAPLGFRQVQVISLEDWTGRRREASYQTLLTAVQALIGGVAGAPTEGATPSPLPAPASALSPIGRPRVAVLAFHHPAEDEEQATFAEALAEDLIAGLARSRLLAVTPRQSSLTYHADQRTVPRICADLGVDYVVQGRIQRLGQRMRISANLMSGADDRGVWSARHERSIADQFELLDEMAMAIVGAIEPAVLDQEQAVITSRRSRNPGHWELFVRGRRHFWRSTHKDIRAAQTLLTQALEIEPDDSQTLALLSHCHMFYVWADLVKDLPGEIAAAHAFALRAVASDPADAFSHFTLGTTLEMLMRQAEARAEFLRALELNPYQAAAAGMLGRLAAFAGQMDEAMNWSDRAIVMSPNDPHLFIWHLDKSAGAFAVEDYPLAVHHALDAVARAPFLFGNHFMLAACYAAGGQTEQAKKAFDAGRRIKGEYDHEAMRICFPFARDPDAIRFASALRSAGWDG
jgi:TolB-like protein